MLYFNYIISKNLQEIGCKSNSGKFWRIVAKLDRKQCYEINDSGDIFAFSFEDIVLNEENAKNIWRAEKIWRFKIQQIFNIVRTAKDKEEAINNFMANEYGYDSVMQMISQEKFSLSENGYTMEEFTMAFKRAMGSLATTVSQKEWQPEEGNKFEVKFLKYSKRSQSKNNTARI